MFQIAEDKETSNANHKEERRAKKKLHVGNERAEITSPKRRAERNVTSSPEENESPKPKHRYVLSCLCH